MPDHTLGDVSIHGFRGLKNLRLDRLGLINLLVGPNNCGKTSVLEAISILCNAFEPYEWVSMVRRRDFGRLDETRIQSLRWCFPQIGKLADPDAVFEGECVMTCHGPPHLRKLRVTYKDIVGDPDPQESERRRRGLVSEGKEEDEVSDIQPSRGADITHFPDDRLPLTARIWEDQPVHVGLPREFRTPIATETLTPYSYQINRVQVRYHSRYLFGTDRDIVLDLIREFDPEITDLRQASFRGMRPALYLEHKRLGPAPLSVFGDALRRAVLLAGTILSLKDGGVLLIDEVETGIHVSVLERVFRWIASISRQLNVQVLATTHSLEAVDAMASATADGEPDLVTYHLDQTADETLVKRIDADLLLRLRRERALDVR